MKHRRTLRAFRASMLVALALTAITTPSAQASGNGLFLINLLNITSVPQKVEGHGGGVSILASGLTIECLLVTFSGVLNSLSTGAGYIDLHECKSPTGGEDVCLVAQTLIPSRLLVFELLLLGKIVRFKAADGGDIKKVRLLSHEEECGLFAGYEVEASIKGEFCAEVVEEDKLKFLLSSTHCPNGVRISGNHAEYHGTNPILIEQLGLKVTTHA